MPKRCKLPMSQDIVNTDKLLSQCQKVRYAWRDDSVGKILTSQKVHLCPCVQDPFKAGYSNLCMYNPSVPLRRLEAERREFPETPVPVKVSIRQWNPVLKKCRKVKICDLSPRCDKNTWKMQLKGDTVREGTVCHGRESMVAGAASVWSSGSLTAGCSYDKSTVVNCIGALDSQ